MKKYNLAKRERGHVTRCPLAPGEGVLRGHSFGTGGSEQGYAGVKTEGSGLFALMLFGAFRGRFDN